MNCESPVPHPALRDAVLKLFLKEECKETDGMLFERGKRTQVFMKEYLEKNPIQGDERIAVVCHSRVIAAMTATGVGPDPENAAKDKLQGFYWMNNCEI